MKGKKSVGTDDNNILLANIMNYELKRNYYYSAVHHNSCGTTIQGYDVYEYVEKSYVQFGNKQFIRSFISGLYCCAIHAFIYLFIYLFVYLFI